MNDEDLSEMECYWAPELLPDWADRWISVPPGGDPIRQGLVEFRTKDGLEGVVLIENEEVARETRKRMVAAGVPVRVSEPRR